MPLFKTLALPVALAAVALAGAPIPSHAYTLSTQHAAVCKPYGDSAKTGLFTQADGAWNFSGAPLTVACPVARPNQAVSGMSVLIDGSAGTGTMSCSVYSYDYTGKYLGGASFSATGVFYRSLYLAKELTPGYSSQLVVCNMPASGRLRDIELSFS